MGDVQHVTKNHFQIEGTEKHWTLSSRKVTRNVVSRAAYKRTTFSCCSDLSTKRHVLLLLSLILFYGILLKIFVAARSRIQNNVVHILMVMLKSRHCCRRTVRPTRARARVPNKVRVMMVIIFVDKITRPPLSDWSRKTKYGRKSREPFM